MTIDDASWWWSSEYGRDRQLRRALEDQAASAAHARRQQAKAVNALRSELEGMRGNLEVKVNALTRSFLAFVELDAIRQRLSDEPEFLDARRFAHRDLSALLEGRPPQERPDVADYWVVPAIAALRPDGSVDAAKAAEARARDAAATHRFHAAARAALGQGRGADAIPDLVEALTPTAGEWDATQLQLWGATLRGAFGPTALPALLARLTPALADVPTETWFEWLVPPQEQAAHGGRRQSVARRPAPSEQAALTALAAAIEAAIPAEAAGATAAAELAGPTDAPDAANAPDAHVPQDAPVAGTSIPAPEGTLATGADADPDAASDTRWRTRRLADYRSPDAGLLSQYSSGSAPLDERATAPGESGASARDAPDAADPAATPEPGTQVTPAAAEAPEPASPPDGEWHPVDPDEAWAGTRSLLIEIATEVVDEHGQGERLDLVRRAAHLEEQLSDPLAPVSDEPPAPETVSIAQAVFRSADDEHTSPRDRRLLWQTIGEQLRPWLVELATKPEPAVASTSVRGVTVSAEGVDERELAKRVAEAERQYQPTALQQRWMLILGIGAGVAVIGLVLGLLGAAIGWLLFLVGAAAAGGGIWLRAGAKSAAELAASNGAGIRHEVTRAQQKAAQEHEERVAAHRVIVADAQRVLASLR